MIKRIKLIFYITSAVLLGLATIWEIYTVRGVLVAGGGKQLDAEISLVQTVVQKWKQRTPFNADSIDKISTPSAARPTKVEGEVTPTTTAEADETATDSADN